MGSYSGNRSLGTSGIMSQNSQFKWDDTLVNGAGLKGFGIAHRALAMEIFGQFGFDEFIVREIRELEEFSMSSFYRLVNSGIIIQEKHSDRGPFRYRFSQKHNHRRVGKSKISLHYVGYYIRCRISMYLHSINTTYGIKLLNTYRRIGSRDPSYNIPIQWGIVGDATV